MYAISLAGNFLSLPFWRLDGSIEKPDSTILTDPAAATHARHYRTGSLWFLVVLVWFLSAPAHAITAKDAYAIARYKGSSYGTTPEVIHASYSNLMLSQLRRPSANTALSRMDQAEFALMVYHFAYYGTWRPARSVIATYAPAHLALFNFYLNYTGVEHGYVFNLPEMYRLYMKQANPNLGMSMTELWLEFRTAPGLALAGELTSIPATTAYLTAYGSVWLTGAWYGGQAIGYGVSWTMKTYVPDWYADVLGRYEATLLTNLAAAVGDFAAVSEWNCVPQDLALEPCTGN